MLVENFRPGVLENWGLGPDVLHELNASLIMLRVNGFGKTGPYDKRMSGFAHQTGEEIGPPNVAAVPRKRRASPRFCALR